MKKIFALILMATTLLSCTVHAQSGVVEREQTNRLTVYRPINARLDLVTQTMPSSDNDSILFCAEAAFTGELLDRFEHHNILGPHICSGVLYQGYAYNERYGCFTWANGEWRFATLPNDELLDSVAASGGMAFTQYWVVRDGVVPRPQIQKDERITFYRVIAERDSQLCIIESTHQMPYGQFLDALVDYGVTNALYMDMGSGWNHSFYRDSSNTLTIIHPRAAASRYCTNWLTMYK